MLLKQTSSCFLFKGLAMETTDRLFLFNWEAFGT